MGCGENICIKDSCVFSQCEDLFCTFAFSAHIPVPDRTVVATRESWDVLSHRFCNPHVTSFSMTIIPLTPV